MKVLVLGGTRLAGVHLVRELLAKGHSVTIATRGMAPDDFGSAVERRIIDRQDTESLRGAFKDQAYDAVMDNLAYSSNEVRALLDTVGAGKYVMASTASVYSGFYMDMQEAQMDTAQTPLKWCGRDDFTYDEVKRQAEAALFQAYGGLPSVAVRFPWIFGADDYSKRLFFYIEHIYAGRSMHVDNPDARLAFIHSAEAGRFLAWCAENPITGPVNAASNGTISLAEIIAYTEKRTGKKAQIQAQGTPAPLNGVPSFCLNTQRAQQGGFCFENVSDWVYETIDIWLKALSQA